MLSTVKLNPALTHDGNFFASVLPHFGPLVCFEFDSFVTVKTNDMQRTNLTFIFVLKRSVFQSSNWGESTLFRFGVSRLMTNDIPRILISWRDTWINQSNWKLVMILVNDFLCCGGVYCFHSEKPSPPHANWLNTNYFWLPRTLNGRINHSWT